MRLALRPRRASRALSPRAARAARPIALGAASAAAAAGLGALARASAARATASVDERVRERAALDADHPVRRAADVIEPLGKWWAYVPIATAGAAWMLATDGRRGPRIRRLGAPATLVGAAGAAALLAQAFDRWLPQPPAPPGHASRRKPVFPSGHTFGPATVALTAAYLLARDGRVPALAAYPVALLVPLLSASGRLHEQKHWASDVLGGYVAAVATAAACLAAYETAADPRPSRGPRRRLWR